jgi:hypothetical protein
MRRVPVAPPAGENVVAWLLRAVGEGPLTPFGDASLDQGLHG